MTRVTLLCLVALGACDATTGSDLVTFGATVAGRSEARSFTAGSGWQLELDRARMHLGSVYLNENVPISGSAEQPCVLPGIYVAQVLGPVDVDLLSSTPVRFPSTGEGTETRARTGEVWLLEGDINRTDDATVVLDLAGRATDPSGAPTYPFRAAVTIGRNRAEPPPSPSMPGAKPICRKRIVTPIAVDLTPTTGRELALTVDVTGMLNGVDFSLLTDDGDGTFSVPDEPGGIGGALFDGLRASVGVYGFALR